MQITRKLKFVEKTTIQKQYAPKLRFLPFFSKTFRMTIKPLNSAAKIIFISMKINPNTQNLKIIPYKQRKMSIQHDALFLQFSILLCITIVFRLVRPLIFMLDINWKSVHTTCSVLGWAVTGKWC